MDIDWKNLCEVLDELWDGPLSRIRRAKFVPADSDEIRAALNSISVETIDEFPRRFVSLLWFIPQFMEWQIERITEHTELSQEYRNLCLWVSDRVGEILGVP